MPGLIPGSGWPDMTDIPNPNTFDVAEPSAAIRLWRRVRGHKGLMFGTTLFLIIVLMGLTAPFLAPYDPYDQDLMNRLVPPVWYEKGSWAHPFGTDNLGRDYLSRTLYGAQISLLIGIAVMTISGVIGTALGLMAGYFGGRVDMAVTFIVTTRLALPVVLVALAVVAMVGGTLLIVIAVLGFLKWDRFAVVMRSATQQVRSLDYVAAAEAAGASTPRIIFGEILPNVAPQLIVVATVEAASAILLEAALSFLGLGVQPPLPSWGLMISEAKNFMFFSFWLIAIPGTALALLVLAINMMGDGLRDVTAPEGRS
ncbi:ABC transporter permease [Phreatobacter aquaticus]|uniref:ABC transporter permease n=2 Tax=Phreatobacter aquaticus TaxID=2570229 RepID=A0A4D7QLM7_9HYPH|nr:ABC transporter permease [Phreatobacter aquaticus]